MNPAILIPVLRRPQRVEPLIENINASGVEANIVFIATSNDFDELAALNSVQHGNVTVLKMLPTKIGDYAKKINFGYQNSPDTVEWFFLGADDIAFRPGWFQAARSAYTATGRRVVGTQDLGNSRVIRGEHSTHSLVHRSYVEEFGTIDQPGLILHDGYPHCFVDDEFVETAKTRDEFVFCNSSVVEHLHPDWGKGETRMDATHVLSRRSMMVGRRVYASRRHLWTSQ